jgi:hypothetical protein
MILKASERSNASNLARHLMNTRDNEHVELHDMRGFVADDLDGAFLAFNAMASDRAYFVFGFIDVAPQQ